MSENGFVGEDNENDEFSNTKVEFMVFVFPHFSL